MEAPNRSETRKPADIATHRASSPSLAALLFCALILGAAVGSTPAQAAPPATDFFRIDTGGSGAIGLAPGAADDANSGAAACTLRDALAIASAGTTAGPVNGCDITAVGSPDALAPVYVVPLPSGGYTYTLVPGFNQDLDINLTTVFIVGDTPDNTFIQADAAPATALTRVLKMFRSTVELSGLTVRHGFHAPAFLFDGGGISTSQGALTLENARVEDNGNRGRGGGIYHDSGTLDLRQGSVVQRNAPTQGGVGSDGAGIYSRGTAFLPSVVTIDASSVRENTIVEGGEGGGIANAGVSTIIVQNGGRVENNVISGHLGLNEGGGISSSGSDAYVIIDAGVVSGNRCIDGVDNGRGGGIHNDFFGTVTIRNGSTIGGAGQGNLAGRGSGIYNGFSGVLVIEDSNVTHNGSDPVGFESMEGGGIYNAASTEIRRSALSNNVAEQFSGGGLFNTGPDAVAIIADSTLSANQSGGLALGFGGGVTTRNGGQVTISDSRLQGNQADGGGGAHASGAGSTLLFDSVDVLGNIGFAGAGIYNQLGAQTTINAATIGSAAMPNVATGLGGGLWNEDPGSLVIVTGSHIDFNQAATGGGIANIEEGRVEITAQSSVNGNQASGAAGGIHNDGIGTTLSLADSSVDGNSAVNEGGGIENSKGATLDLLRVSVNGNQAGSHGGGIRNDQGFGFGLRVSAVSLADSVLSGNTSGGGGGAISSESAFESTARIEITNSRIGGTSVAERNSAQLGGAIHLVAAAASGFNELSLREGSRVQGNASLGGGGGALYAHTAFDGPVTVVASDSAIVENEASGSGGGFYSVADSGGSVDIDVERTRIVGNRADEQGGGIHEDSLFNFGDSGTTTIDVSDSTLASNEAGLEGGAVYHGQTSGISALVITDAVLSENVAADGGALYHAGGTSRVNASCIQDNTNVAFVNAGAGIQDGTGNWWGAADGPGPVGPGSGDTVSNGVDFSGFVAAPFANCGVLIDVHPGNQKNNVNLKGNGKVSVAILGSSYFDVDDVDLESVLFEGASPDSRKTKYKDVDKDGFLDVVTYYRIRETDIEPGQTKACLRGETLGGDPFDGCDAIRTVPLGPKEK